MIREWKVTELTKDGVSLSWTDDESCQGYDIYWSDSDREDMVYKKIAYVKEASFHLNKSTHRPHYIKVLPRMNKEKQEMSSVYKTPVTYSLDEQLENLSRGMIAMKTRTGIFLSWRLFKDEVDGYNETGMTGKNFRIYKNGIFLQEIYDSTNYLDTDGEEDDLYQVAGIWKGHEDDKSETVKASDHKEAYFEIPIQRPQGGMTKAKETFVYHANDMSIGDVDGDGEYEYIVKWDPTNAHDVSHKGYTGNCILDCYKITGQRLWRLDMGRNIRAGAHYTQFMVFDFDGDQKAEMSVKTAPGTCMTIYGKNQNIISKKYISIPERDLKRGISHQDDYVCDGQAYRSHLIEVFKKWDQHVEVVNGHWPKTLEACFGIEERYEYPLSLKDAEALVDYFLDVYALQRNPKNKLRDFEGFVFQGPEYLTMFSGDGQELETIPFPFPRQDDGLLWGDYSMPRIEPCNRVDRFLSGVAYLDGEHPALIIARGYYTRTTLVAYAFRQGHHKKLWAVDSGHVIMKNPFKDYPHAGYGSHPYYGRIAGQGNHSMATVDVDGDGKQEIIYGACVIDHDGSILYSSEDRMPDGSIVKMGHGDAMHVARIDPMRPGFEIFNVFEGGIEAPYGFALRDAETGEAYFGEYVEEDLGRCMIGDVCPDICGYQVWVKEVFDCRGNRLPYEALGTNQSIRWAGDMSTQIIDGANYLKSKNAGVIQDYSHGVMLRPEGVAMNNGTKGNPCLVADVLGDFREELLVRTEDDSSIRIYTNTDVCHHKLFTMMHDTQYRCGVAWQNNCYNQPCYPSFYYGSDMHFEDVMPEVKSRLGQIDSQTDSQINLQMNSMEVMQE